MKTTLDLDGIKHALEFGPAALNRWGWECGQRARQDMEALVAEIERLAGTDTK